MALASGFHPFCDRHLPVDLVGKGIAVCAGDKRVGRWDLDFIWNAASRPNMTASRPRHYVPDLSAKLRFLATNKDMRAKHRMSMAGLSEACGKGAGC
jgi:hypothetical protein